MEKQVLNFRLDIRNKIGKRQEKGLQSISLLPACVPKKTLLNISNSHKMHPRKTFHIVLSQLLRNYQIAPLYNVNLHLGGNIYHVSLFFLLHRHTHRLVSALISYQISHLHNSCVLFSHFQQCWQ